ncbi:hypothetical protein [Desulfatitalea alkaliphila]|uniref:Tetratricopeptide repeat-containing protein n=1 Tax=Desulfatitalea alkaliphila TaxID=2929485 RepID=A0AA41R589_9BACT|nr:hypothetical protein [Desulfatitalea alkaliphila]MCJ8502554.1 hypothetical protein [Desulfatitalea alkaliphila]
MTPKEVPCTAAMAHLLAEQGYWRKAAAMYRALIAQHPERGDLRSALQHLEQRQAERQAPTRRDVALLLREWSDELRANNKQRSGGKKTC